MAAHGEPSKRDNYMRTYMRACAGVATAFAIVAAPLVLASAADAAPYAKHPRTKVSSGHVKPGGALTVSGSGWRNDTEVQISLAPGVVLGTATVNPDGTFSMNFTMPADLACHYDVTTRGLATGVVTSNQITVGDCSGHSDKGKNDGKGSAAAKGAKGGKGEEKSTAKAVTEPVTTFVSNNPKAAGGMAAASVLPIGGIALLRARRR
jgi:hypothetical protein